MHLLSRALEWVGEVLCRPHGTSRPARITRPESGGDLPVHHPSPEMWGAILAGARRRRAPHLWPCPQPPAVEDHSIARALVRAYVLPKDERTLALSSSAREAQ